MKIKTSELSGAALDWAVAKCDGIALVDGCIFTKDPDDEQVLFVPSSDWAQGGPIIERESIALLPSGDWGAVKNLAFLTPTHHGPTPLIAAMRCYVAFKLGDEVDVPDELN